MMLLEATQGRGQWNHGTNKMLATGLGWFSVGLGLFELILPRVLARVVGVRERSTLLRVLGLRELASGVGILAARRPAGSLWSRVLGDAIDLSLLGVALAKNRRRPASKIAAAAGVAGVTVLDVLAARRALSTTGPVELKKSITINAAPEQVYAFFRDFENLPRFMRHLDSIKVDGRRSHWKADIAGTKLEWDAEIVEERPGELISWRTIGDSTIDHQGTVRFGAGPAGRGTVVHLSMSYRPPAGGVGRILAKIFRKIPELEVNEDLRRLKQLIEAGELATTEGQPSGRERVRVRGRKRS